MSFNVRGPAWLVCMMAALWLAAAAWLCRLPQLYAPARFRMPGAPFTAALAMLANLHLICASFCPFWASLQGLCMQIRAWQEAWDACAPVQDCSWLIQD